MRTKSQAQARYAAQKLVSRLDDDWSTLRIKEADIPASHLLRSVPSQNIHSILPTINDALDLHLRVKGEGRSPAFFDHSKRSVDYVVQCLGCRSLDHCSSADAADFRDWLRKRGLSVASVQRNFNSLKAMVNFSIQELGLECRNAFTGVYLAYESPSEKRQPITTSQIKRLQEQCYLIDDDIR